MCFIQNDIKPYHHPFYHFNLQICSALQYSRLQVWKVWMFWSGLKLVRADLCSNKFLLKLQEHLVYVLYKHCIMLYKLCIKTDQTFPEWMSFSRPAVTEIPVCQACLLLADEGLETLCPSIQLSADPHSSLAVWQAPVSSQRGVWGWKLADPSSAEWCPKNSGAGHFLWLTSLQ